MAGFLGPVLGAVASTVLGGLLGSKEDKNRSAQQYAQQSRSQSSSQSETGPWEGVIPYLTGDGLLPSYLYGTPDIYRPWLEWAQGAGAGENLDAPPPMLIDYIRAQEGIGTVDGQPARESDRVTSMPVGTPPPPPAAQPAPAAQPTGNSGIGGFAVLPSGRVVAYGSAYDPFGSFNLYGKRESKGAIARRQEHPVSYLRDAVRRDLRHTNINNALNDWAS